LEWFLATLLVPGEKESTKDWTDSNFKDITKYIKKE
jgi:hypothetical protein